MKNDINLDREKIVLLDANAIMHRAYHALPPLVTASGELVNMVYGFTSVLLRVIKDLNPDYMIAAFDVAGGTFRDKIFPDYKLGRKKPEQDFYDQIQRVKELLLVLGVPMYEQRGYEADDIIGTLASLSKVQNLQVVIVTGDMDALQLVDKDVSVYAFKKGISDVVIYDEPMVWESYQIGPRQIIDFKSLRGDDSDNIPGVSGIGDKSAKKLLNAFNDLETIYTILNDKGFLPDISPKINQKLILNKDSAFLSQQLATIKTDVELIFDLNECRWGVYDFTIVRNLFQDLEFFSLLPRLPDNRVNEKLINDNTENVITQDITYGLVDNDAEFLKLKQSIELYQYFILSTTVSEKKIAQKTITQLVLIFPNNHIFIVPVQSHTAMSLFDSGVSDFLYQLKPFLENESYLKIGFNLKNDLENLAAYDIYVRGLKFDVMLAAYLLDPGKRDYPLDKIIFNYLKNPVNYYLQEEIKDLYFDNNYLNLFHLFSLVEVLGGDLKNATMDDLFQQIEMPLIYVLCDIEMNGINLDVEFLSTMSLVIQQKISDIAVVIYEMANNHNFNINSSKQLVEVLFNEMHLPTTGIKKGKTGYSIAAKELNKLYDCHPIIAQILRYRELVKLKNTYIDTLPKLINPYTNRLHTTFHQTITATGRLSSSDPNLQNIPIRTEEGREIRYAFVAESDRLLLSADYSQIELRIIAMMANDQKMQEIFRQGLDIHTATAATINQVKVEDVTHEMRRAAKALNFGMIYGMSVFGFAQSAQISHAQAKYFIESYMKNFSAVAEYLEQSKKLATVKGYAETAWGRRRYLSELKTSNAFLRNTAERMAINMPIQGTAADLMKISMLKIYEWVKEVNSINPDSVKILLQVHDELLFSIKQNSVVSVKNDIKNIMERCYVDFLKPNIGFDIPIVVDIKVGKSWGEM